MDARLDVAYKDQYRLRAGYQRFNKVQTGVGSTYALDNLGTANVDLYTADLTAKNKFTDDFSTDSKILFLW